MPQEPVAIVGMGCRYPGAEGLDAFWRALCAGTDAITPVPASRWDAAALHSKDASQPGTIVSREGGFIEGLETFDAAFFGISPREAPHVDPRQRLALEVAWEALEHAGIPPDGLSGTATGVFLATLTNDYDHLLFADLRRAEAYSGAGTANSVVANRISYLLDLRGPSVAIDTACSGSLVAIHLACESLRSGESTLALAGGVGVNLMAKSNVFFSRAGALSPTGRCRAFDAAADGIVRSDGAGVVVLKLLSRATADGDTIVAVVAGSAVNHDGRSNGIMAPNGDAQRAVLTRAYEAAGIDPARVQYVEAHGTGTPLGDPIEMQALGSVLAAGRAPQARCVVGSVKTNIGHTEAAAGVAGVIKTALALRHRRIPPSVHFERPNPLLELDRGPFSIAADVGPWPSAGEPLVAGVSAFGFGGTNAHVVLRDAPAESPAPRHDAPPYLLTLSARSSDALRAVAAGVRRLLDEDAGDPAAICRSAAVHRMHHAHRAALVAGSARELAEKIDVRMDALARRPGEAASKHPRIAFVFSGQGSQAPDMGRQLYDREPEFARVLDECDALVAQRTGLSIRSEMWAPDAAARLRDVAVAQTAIVATEIALASLWQSWNVRPAVVIGHSVGEIAAAWCAGALTLVDAMRVVCERGRLMTRLSGLGSTAVVGLSVADVQQFLDGHGTGLSIAGSNGPNITLVAGPTPAVASMMQALERARVFCRLVADVPFHSPQMAALQPELVAALADLAPLPPRVPLVSTVNAQELGGSACDAPYWAANLREPVLFSQALLRLDAYSCAAVLEIGAHPVLGSAIAQTLRRSGRRVRVLGSLQHGRPDADALSGSLAALYELGVGVAWRAVLGDGPRVALPTYPWQRQRYWFDQLDSGAAEQSETARTASPLHPLLGERIDTAFGTGDGIRHSLWELDVTTSGPLPLGDHRVFGTPVWPAAATLELALAAGMQLFPGARVEVADAVFLRPLRVEDGQRLRLQATSAVRGGSAEFAVFSREQDGWTRHLTATVREAADAPEPPPESLASLAEACADQVSLDGHYADLELGGLAYGPAFRLIRQLRRGIDCALARVDHPSLRNDHAAFAVHPTTLDAAFQTVAAALSNERTTAYLPSGIARWRVSADRARPVWCHARLRGKSRDQCEADVVLLDDRGVACAWADGLILRRPSGSATLRGSLIDERWVPAPLPDARRAPARWVLLSDLDGVADRVGRHLSGHGHQVIYLRPGDRYHRTADNEIELRVGERADLARALGDLAHAGLHVVHLWSLTPSGTGPTSGAPIHRAGLASAVHLAQLLADEGRGGRLWLVAQGSQPAGDELPAPSGAPLSGLALAIEHECPALAIRFIDLPAGGADAAASALASELVAEDVETRVAWRGGQRFVARLSRMKAPPSWDDAPPALRGDAAYLVSGGAGALGLDVARALIGGGARHLLLASRRGEHELDAPALNAVADLRARGADVRLVAADVASPDACARLDSALASMPPLAGIVHAAGVVADAPLHAHDDDRMAAVLAPKVDGAWNLHLLSATRALDFFVAFSSAASLIGSSGQAAYAAANAFLDALAYHRRALGMPAVCINWGPWGGAGMAATDGVRQSLARRGITPLDPSEALSVFRSALAPDAPVRVGVLTADWPTFARQFARGPSRYFERVTGITKEIPTAPVAIAALPPDARGGALQALVREHCAAVLGFANPSDIGSTDTFRDIGLDSLTAVELASRLETVLGLPIPRTLPLDNGSVEAMSVRLATLLETA